MDRKETREDLVPVSLLCGFLGAGKTTMMKHILETKHQDEDFKCAVIVNDMAALNIDKSLIDKSALVQSDEVIAMQNGCFCCTLQSDLVDQIISLCARNMFNYILIEASGVSEPSQIAPLFDLCDDEHDPDDPEADHEHDEGKPQLGEVARLDTCVTVVDSAEFYNNLESMNTYVLGENIGTIAELMMEQVEFSNVVVLNKTDLVNDDQIEDIVAKVKLIKPDSRIIKSTQSKVDIMQILNTGLYKPIEDKDEFWIETAKVAEEEKLEAESLECCEKSISIDGVKCCKSKVKDEKFVDTRLSQVQLEVVLNSSKDRKITRHEKRFGITSFIYRARRPFHPGRLCNLFLEPYFPDMKTLSDEEEDDTNDEDSDDEDYEDTDDEDSDIEWIEDPDKITIKPEKITKTSEEEKRANLEYIQKEASLKQKLRTERLGELLRSKGFVWIATCHNVMGEWQQAGNVLKLEAETSWMCEVRDAWMGTPSEDLVMKDILQSNGEEFPFGDRRQELVFIGQNLKHEEIQKVLDNCLLNDQEMNLGPERWKKVMDKDDKIQDLIFNGVYWKAGSLFIEE